MSELNNPLFENQREFLERQKEEYKNALIGDVDQIKTQGQEIGKKVAMAGGVILAGYLLKRLFSSDSDDKKEEKREKKAKTAKKPKVKNTYRHPVAAPITIPTQEYSTQVHAQQAEASAVAEHDAQDSQEHTSTALSKGFMKSDLAQVLSQQVIVLLMVYITKKVEEYVHSVSKNNDIAAAPIEVIEIETTEYIVPDQNAF